MSKAEEYKWNVRAIIEFIHIQCVPGPFFSSCLHLDTTLNFDHSHQHWNHVPIALWHLLTCRIEIGQKSTHGTEDRWVTLMVSSTVSPQNLLYSPLLILTRGSWDGEGGWSSRHYLITKRWFLSLLIVPHTSNSTLYKEHIIVYKYTVGRLMLHISYLKVTSFNGYSF